MSSIVYSLVWKEWREHRWDLAGLTAGYVATICIAGYAVENTLFGAASVALTVVVPLASMIIAMGIAAGERSRGTIGFLQSLPTAITRPAAAKLSLALVTVIAPPLLALGATRLLSLAMYPEVVEELLRFDLEMYGTSWGLENWYLARALAASAGAASVLLWMAAVGVNRSDEVRAGAVGLLVVMAVWSALVLGGARLREAGPVPGWWNVVYGLGPGAVAAVGNRAETENQAADWRPYAPAIVGAAAILHAGLGAWYVLRFGRKGPAKVAPGERSLAAVAEPVWLGLPRRGPIAAIGWKQIRESAPLALLGGGLTVGASAAMGAYQYATGGEDVDGVVSVAMVTGWAWVGLFVSLVAGIGLYMDDLQPRLHAFWRSRPIDVDVWFGVKLVTGAVTTLALLAAPPAATLTAARLAGLRMDDHERMMSALATLAPTLLSMQFALFCLAVMAIVLVRQAVFAAILALAAAGVVLAACVRWELGDHPSLIAAWVVSAAAIAVAWIGLRRDWSWAR